MHHGTIEAAGAIVGKSPVLCATQLAGSVVLKKLKCFEVMLIFSFLILFSFCHNKIHTGTDYKAIKN